VASRPVGPVGLVDVLRRDFHQSPSRRPDQSEQLQGPLRVRLCGGGAIQAPDGRRKRRARGERGVGTGAPSSLRGRLPARPAEPCVFATWKPFLLMWGDGRLSGIDNSTYARGKPEM